MPTLNSLTIPTFTASPSKQLAASSSHLIYSKTSRDTSFFKPTPCSDCGLTHPTAVRCPDPNLSDYDRSPDETWDDWLDYSNRSRSGSVASAPSPTHTGSRNFDPRSALHAMTPLTTTSVTSPGDNRLQNREDETVTGEIRLQIRYEQIKVRHPNFPVSRLF